jgi:hypothetical protein
MAGKDGAATGSTPMAQASGGQLAAAVRRARSRPRLSRRARRRARRAADPRDAAGAAAPRISIVSVRPENIRESNPEI